MALNFLSLDRWRTRPIPVAVIGPKPALTLDVWRTHDTRTGYMRDLLKQPLFRDALCVLYNAIPRGYPARGELVNDTMAAIELGRIQGFMDALGVIYQMGTPAHKPVDIQPTYLTDTEDT